MTTAKKTESAVEYFEQFGWISSHTPTIKGAVLEKLDDGELRIIVINSVGTILSECRFDEYSCDAGCAAAAVTRLYLTLNAEPVGRS